MEKGASSGGSPGVKVVIQRVEEAFLLVVFFIILSVTALKVNRTM